MASPFQFQEKVLFLTDNERYKKTTGAAAEVPPVKKTVEKQKVFDANPDCGWHHFLCRCIYKILSVLQRGHPVQSLLVSMIIVVLYIFMDRGFQLIV